MLETGFEQIEELSVLGVSARIKRGSETSELFAGIWKEFELHGEFIESLCVRKQYYGVNFPTGKEDVTEYLAGMAVADDSPVAEGLEKRKIPAGAYAIFKCPVEGIGECYQGIFTNWLPNAKLLLNPENPVFEEYPEKNSTLPVRLYIPVTKIG